MGRKKLVAYEVVKRKEYGYEPYPIKEPKQTEQPPAAVPVQQYVKKEKPKRGLFGLGRRKKRTPEDAAADEFGEAADMLEAMR